MRYALIVCEDNQALGCEKGVGEKMIRRLRQAGCHGDEWTAIHAITKQMPPLATLLTYDGIVVSGSRHSVNCNAEWVKNLEASLRELIDYLMTNCQPEIKRRPKLFGICFGHQVIAKAMGGKVAQNPNGKFNWGSECVQLSQDLASMEFITKVFPDRRDSFRIYKSHGEQVVQKPRHARLVGTSSSCVTEVLTYGVNVMTMQGHPESSLEKVKMFSVPNMRKKKFLSENELNSAIQGLEHVDWKYMIQVMLSFLRCS